MLLFMNNISLRKNQSISTRKLNAFECQMKIYQKLNSHLQILALKKTNKILF